MSAKTLTDEYIWKELQYILQYTENVAALLIEIIVTDASTVVVL